MKRFKKIFNNKSFLTKMIFWSVFLYWAIPFGLSTYYMNQSEERRLILRKYLLLPDLCKSRAEQFKSGISKVKNIDELNTMSDFLEQSIVPYCVKDTKDQKLKEMYSAVNTIIKAGEDKKRQAQRLNDIRQSEAPTVECIKNSLNILRASEKTGQYDYNEFYCLTFRRDNNGFCDLMNKCRKERVGIRNSDGNTIYDTNTASVKLASGRLIFGNKLTFFDGEYFYSQKDNTEKWIITYGYGKYGVSFRGYEETLNQEMPIKYLNEIHEFQKADNIRRFFDKEAEQRSLTEVRQLLYGLELFLPNDEAAFLELGLALNQTPEQRQNFSLNYFFDNQIKILKWPTNNLLTEARKMNFFMKPMRNDSEVRFQFYNRFISPVESSSYLNEFSILVETPSQNQSIRQVHLLNKKTGDKILLFRQEDKELKFLNVPNVQNAEVTLADVEKRLFALFNNLVVEVDVKSKLMKKIALGDFFSDSKNHFPLIILKNKDDDKLIVQSYDGKYLSQLGCISKIERKIDPMVEIVVANQILLVRDRISNEKNEIKLKQCDL